MAAPYLDILEKTEAAMQSVVDALALSGVASLTGSDDATKSTPCVISIAESCDGEQPQFSGNHTVHCRVTVVTQAADFPGLSTHRARAATVFDAFSNDGLAASMSAAVTDYYVYPSSLTVGGYSKDNTETQFQDSILFDIYACGRDLS